MSKQSYMGLEERRGYQWPAQELTGYEMKCLQEWRDKTGLPISRLLKECILKIDQQIKNKHQGKVCLPT